MMDGRFSNSKNEPNVNVRGTFAALEELEAVSTTKDADDMAISFGVFNLVSTIVGGGLLSLPYAFKQCGLALGCVLLMLTAGMSGYTVQLLIRCSILSNSDSFDGIARYAFGHRGSVCTCVALVMLTWLVAVAYIILLGDVAVPVIQFLFHISNEARDSHDMASIRTITYLAALTCVSPLTFMQSLSALKFTSMISISSITLLVVAIFINSDQDGFGNPTGFAQASDDSSIMWVGGAKSFTAFSIISVSFLCHFNVLPATRSVAIVTKPRVNSLVYRTMGICCVLYSVAAVAGYLNFRGLTCGNILLNYDSNSSKLHLITIGRMALFLALCCSLPLMVHPCRENAEKLMLLLRTKPDSSKVDDAEGFLEEENEVTIAEFSTRRRVLHALVINVSAMISAIFIPGVQVVWTFMGSTVAIVISYMLPTAFYLRIKQMEEAELGSSAPTLTSKQKLKRGLALMVFCVGGVLVLICSTVAIVEQVQGEDTPSYCK